MQYSIKDLIKKLNKKIKNNSFDFTSSSFPKKLELKEKNFIQVEKVIENDSEKDVWDTLNINDLPWAIEKLVETIKKEIEDAENCLNKVCVYNEPVDNSILNEISSTLNTMSYRQFKDLVNKDARRNS